MSKLTGLKDTDREVLKYISDESLLKVCSIDKNFWNEVCDDNFLKRRLSKYPDIEKYKKENETWKEFFLKFLYYTSKMREKYKFNYISGDFRKQYDLFKNDDLELTHKEGERVIIENILKKYADVFHRPFFAMGFAASHGYLNIVKYLTETGFDINQQDYLAFASGNGHLDIVKYLVEHGADIHSSGDHALRFASANGHLDVVKYLAEHGANVHAKNDDAFKMARKGGHVEVLEYLNRF